MNNNTKINVQIVEENRPNLTAFGNLYGRRILKAVKTPVIIDFASRLEQANHNKDLFLNRNINRYKVLGIDITALALRKGIDDDYEIVINEGLVDEAGEDIEVRCPITKHDITTEVDVDNIAKALNKDGGNNIFFSSGKKLSKFLNAENAKERARVNALIDELQKIDKAIETTEERNTQSSENYYRQLDGKKEVRVHVEVDE